jgi:hypothetical protein
MPVRFWAVAIASETGTPRRSMAFAWRWTGVFFGIA